MDDEMYKYEISKYELLYSPRTCFNNNLELEDKLFKELIFSFDAITIKIIKKHFKEKIGFLDKEEFIGILKKHLLSWNPNIDNREEVLVKLLSRLFEEIVINDNCSIDWDDFINYILYSTKNDNSNMSTYQLNLYETSKRQIDTTEFSDYISHCFYIIKFNMIGIVIEGRSNIIFYNASNCTKLNTSIDIKEMLKDIDELENKNLDRRAEEKVLKDEQNLLKKKIVKMNRYTKSQNTITVNNQLYSLSLSPKRRSINRLALINSKRQRGNESHTPEKLRKELKKIKHSKIFTQRNAKLTVLCTLFLSEYDVLLVSSTNNKISAWKYYNGEFKIANTLTSANLDKNDFYCLLLTSDIPQYTMTWDNQHKVLYTGQADGKILKWSLLESYHIEGEIIDILSIKSTKSRRNINVVEDKNENQFETIQTCSSVRPLLNEIKMNDSKIIMKREYQKRDNVSCIITLTTHQLLAVSYYNGIIILWDPLYKECRKYYNDQETGVYQIAFDSLQNLLFSCGFDHDIYVYHPFIDNSAIYKLTGHNCSINSIAVNESESQMISLDILGNIKIWDTKKYFNFQTININDTIHGSKKTIQLNPLSYAETSAHKKKIASNLRLIFISKMNRILVYGNEHFQYEKMKGANLELTDDRKVIGCFYNKSSMEIVTICFNTIKFWNILTGKIKRFYDNLMKAEISSFTVDDKLKRIYLGDTDGRIKKFNLFNGRLLKEFERHDKGIYLMAYSRKLSILITISLNNVFKIHSDSELNQSLVLFNLPTIESQIKSMHLSPKLKGIVLGLGNGSVKFYDLDHHRMDSPHENDYIKNLNNDSVSNIASIEETELIFVAHESGRCHLMILPPNKHKFQILCCFTNHVIHMNNEIPSSHFTYSLYESQNHFLYTGDYLGYIKCFDFTEIIQKCFKNKINDELIKAIDLIQIKEIWCTKPHKASICHIYLDREISPGLLLTTGEDLKVKLLSLDNKGEYLEELKQENSQHLPIPIGIEYSYRDIFNPNKKEPTKILKGTIIRSDIGNFKMEKNKNIEYQTALEYTKEITEYNAKEKLFFLSRGNSLKASQSNNWNYNIVLSYIQKKQEESITAVESVIKRNQNDIKNSELQMRNTNIYNENYYPFFLHSVTKEKSAKILKELSQKERHIHLAVCKAQIRMQSIDIGEARTRNKQKPFPIIKSQNRDSLRIRTRGQSFIKNKNTIETNISTAKLAKFKEDFDKKINELDKPLNALKNKMSFINLPKLRTEASDIYDYKNS